MDTLAGTIASFLLARIILCQPSDWTSSFQLMKSGCIQGAYCLTNLGQVKDMTIHCQPKVDWIAGITQHHRTMMRVPND